MDVLAHQIEIEGPADKIPERVEVDVTALGVHEHVTAADIPLPPGFKLLTPPDTVVITIEPSRTAQDLEAAAAGPQEGAEPAVVGAETPSEGG
jgi:large subunit ribosomal protein L25